MTMAEKSSTVQTEKGARKVKSDKENATKANIMEGSLSGKPIEKENVSKVQQKPKVATDTMPGKREEKDNTSTALSEKIIENALEVQKTGSLRSKTLFYNIVSGGATEVVRNTIDMLKNSDNYDDHRLYKWLVLGVDEDSPQEEDDNRTVKYIIFFLIWIIFTPIFYAVHRLIYSILNTDNIRQYYRISQYEKLDFPLAFALFSGKKAMLELFMKYGILITQKDKDGNNIMHYLVDLSVHDLPRAKLCFEILKELRPKSQLSYLLTKAVNLEGQSALENAFQFGNLSFACSLMDFVMAKRVLDIENENVKLEEDIPQMKSVRSGSKMSTNSILPLHSEPTTAVPASIVLQGRNASKSSETKHNECEFNKDTNDDLSNGFTVTKLDITNQTLPHGDRYGISAFLLHLMISRSTTAISEESLKAIQNNSHLQKWIRLKNKNRAFLLSYSAFVDVFITILFIFGMLLNTQGDMLLTPNASVLVHEHTKIFLNKWNTTGSTDTLNAAVGEKFFTTYPDIIEAITNGGKKMDYVELLKLINQMDGYSDYSKENLEQLYNELCVTGDEYFHVGDLVTMDNCTKSAADELLTICEPPDGKENYYYYNNYKSQDHYELVIASSFLMRIFNSTNSKYKSVLLNEGYVRETYAFHIFLIIFWIIYLLLDIGFRLRTVWQQINTNLSVYSILAMPLPGSYVKAQCNVCFTFGSLLITFYYWRLLSQYYLASSVESDLKDDILKYDRLQDTNDIKNNTSNFIMSLIMIAVLISRIIAHLNTFKLFPWIGHFMITTFEMASDLIRFTLIYTVMISLIGAIFFLVSRSTECPFYRDEQNVWFGRSVFTTFALPFGHVDINFNNGAVQMTYIAYIIMSVFLLLNLIIAVMSSTASRVTVEPWSTQLYQEGLLSESFGMEFWGIKEFTIDEEKVGIYLTVYEYKKIPETETAM